MSITILKSILSRFFNIKTKQKVSTFPNSMVSYLELVNWMTLDYYRLFNVHVRTMGMHLVLLNILICHQGETILVLDIH